MALLSTFELLTKPIAPAGSGPVVVARTIVQGYFLTIANTSNVNVRVQLLFTATTPGLNIVDTVTISDVTGTNDFSDLTPVPGDPKKFTFTVGIPSHDTALVSLLPDLTNANVLANKNLEIRGYVDISLITPFGPKSVDLLVTPEHRGTFLPLNLGAAIPDFDQLAYALPTANGSSKYTLTGPAKPSKELKLEIKEIKEIKEVKEFDKNQIKEIETKAVPEVIDPKVAETLPLENPATPVVSNGMQQILGVLAQRLDDLEWRAVNGQSFIQPQERPSVGEQVVNQPRN